MSPGEDRQGCLSECFSKWLSGSLSSSTDEILQRAVLECLLSCRALQCGSIDVAAEHLLLLTRYFQPGTVSQCVDKQHITVFLGLWDSITAIHGYIASVIRLFDQQHDPLGAKYTAAASLICDTYFFEQLPRIGADFAEFLLGFSRITEYSAAMRIITAVESEADRITLGAVGDLCTRIIDTLPVRPTTPVLTVAAKWSEDLGSSAGAMALRILTGPVSPSDRQAYLELADPETQTEKLLRHLSAVPGGNVRTIANTPTVNSLLATPFSISGTDDTDGALRPGAPRLPQVVDDMAQCHAPDGDDTLLLPGDCEVSINCATQPEQSSASTTQMEDEGIDAHNPPLCSDPGPCMRVLARRHLYHRAPQSSSNWTACESLCPSHVILPVQAEPVRFAQTLNRVQPQVTESEVPTDAACSLPGTQFSTTPHQCQIVPNSSILDISSFHEADPQSSCSAQILQRAGPPQSSMALSVELSSEIPQFRMIIIGAECYSSSRVSVQIGERALFKLCLLFLLL